MLFSISGLKDLESKYNVVSILSLVGTCIVAATRDRGIIMSIFVAAVNTQTVVFTFGFFTSVQWQKGWFFESLATDF